MKVLHSICQEIWKTQPLTGVLDCKRSVFIPIPKKGNAPNIQTTTQLHSSHTLAEERESKRRSVMSDSLQPHGLYSPRNSLGQNTGGVSLSLLQGNLPNPRVKPRSPTLQVDSLPAEPQEMLKILQARLQQYMNQELPDVQAGF